MNVSGDRNTKRDEEIEERVVRVMFEEKHIQRACYGFKMSESTRYRTERECVVEAIKGKFGGTGQGKEKEREICRNQKLSVPVQFKDRKCKERKEEEKRGRGWMDRWVDE